MFSTTLTFHGQSRSFAVESVPASGWEIRVEQDSRVVRRTHYTDWHRVERAVEAIRREMRDLQARGWRVISEFGIPDAR
jgi:hypothetical protein